MELTLQPKPEVEILPASQGIVSRKEFFVKKKFEKIEQYFFPAHFFRNWKPKAELLYPSVSDETAIQYECDFNRDVQSCFVEDFAEEVFLRTPPPCFVVIGKFGASVSKLGRQLAEKFGSVLIHAEEIIGQVLQTETETAKTLHRLLRLGVSLSLNFILSLLSYAAHTAEARHRGYVLCGLPCIPEECDLPAEQQLNYLFTWDNKPTVFINVLFDDEDLIKERTSSRCEIESSGRETYLFVREKECRESEEAAEEETDEESEPGKEEPHSCGIDVSPSRPCVQLPKDEESQVWLELELFDTKIRPAIELLISRVDPQYFITVDSRLENEIDVVLARLSLLQVWKVPTAVPFISPKRKLPISDRNASEENVDEAEERGEEDKNTENYEIDPEIQLAAQEPPQVAFLTLFTKNNISAKFRWELSHYNYICPVSLREGELIEGKSEFAVVFMKYIYFLRDEDAMLKFIRNPRAYVLPIRPEPLTRFIILGYPYSGKTALAGKLALQFSIPLIDVSTILKNDLDRKKNIYQEFCRQKAECRETIRLNAQAWQEWRREEEHRICLIEEWIAYIQTLLSQRIEHFYSLGEADETSSREVQIQAYSPVRSRENVEAMSEGSAQSESSGDQVRVDPTLGVQGVAIAVVGTDTTTRESPSPSDKIMKAMKHEDFDFNEPCLEVEANLFFSSLWNTFSNENQRNSSGNITNYEEFGGEEFVGELVQPEVEEESATVDWCSLLPPQSLSSFLMSKMPYTTREKRQSFKIFLEAASKAYWTPCKLKTEFAKWRLPCYMDIPLCEIFLDNPILLLKYVPEWLKERPLIPDPVDPQHPSVVAAGQSAFIRAGVVTIKQNKEEVALLIRDAVEKAEREGMRVTGEVMSPGGWVLDNMTFDLDIWKRLACESIFPDHVYILTDSEPENRRIVNTWCQLNQTTLDHWNDFKDGEEEDEEEEELLNQLSSKQPKKSDKGHVSKGRASETGEHNLLDMLAEIAKANANEDYQLDEIFDRLLDDFEECQGYVPPISVDAFAHHIFGNSNDTWFELKEETATEEALMAIQTLSHSSTINFFDKHNTNMPFQDVPLGHQLQKFTKSILNAFKKKVAQEEKKLPEKQSLSDSLQFFISLLTLPAKIQNLKEWLSTLDRSIEVKELEITNRTHSLIFDIRKELMKHFLKKPRELEAFEVDEIKKSEEREERLLKKKLNNQDEEMDPEDQDENEEEEEDLRIFGESGSLCIVNLEKDIFLPGRREFALRYYGKLYYFWDEKSKERFFHNPQKYAPYYSAIRCYPPLRVFITGPLGSGKSTMAVSLANEFSLTYVDNGEFLMKKLVPHLSITYEKFTSLGDPKLLLEEDYNAAAKEIKEKFMNAPHDLRKFWLENPVYEEEIETKAKFRKKLILLNKPVVSRNYPELHFESLDSLPEETKESNLLSRSATSQNSYTSMKALESIVRNYFENSAELTEYCIEKTAKTFWTKEPYLSQGLIVEGYPLRFSDLSYMAANNWWPDVIIEITLPEHLVVDRNIDALMDAWDAQLKKEMVEEKTLEDTLATVQRLNMRLRRTELIAKKRSTVALVGPEEELLHTRKISKKDSNVFAGLSEQSIPEIEETLKNEFPPLSFNPVFETYEAAKARITENLLRSYKRDMAEIEKIRGVCQEFAIPWCRIDSLKDVDDNLIETSLLLDKLRRRESVKKEFAFPVDMEMAEKLLEQGFYFLSKFGRWCPVQVYRMKNPIHMFRPLSGKRKITPIVYRNYIYFVGGENEKLNFIRDPIKYTFNDPHHPNVPLRVAVIGPPKSGKSTLSKRLGRTFGMKVVTIGSAIRFVLEKMPKSTLAKAINNYLRRGCFLPLSFKVEALVTCLNDPACITQGFVFDGVPFDAALTQSLAERGKLPFVIISLVADSDFGKTNRQGLDLTEFRLPYKNRVNLDSRYKDWKETYKRFAQWNHHTYNNLYEVNAKLNVVDIFYQAYDIIRKSFFGILYYVEYCVSNRVLPLHYLCVGQHEYELRKSSFHNNCPVCWAEDKKLSNTPNPPPRSGLVQYQQHFYWICPNHMEKFIQKPKTYLPPTAPSPPHLLPKMISKAQFESLPSAKKIHGYGRCPVTRTDFPGVLDWEGSWDYAAFYAEKVYLCKSKEMLDRFLARPWRYARANTEFEVNRVNKSNAVEQLGPPKVTSLPPVGFLEQTVSDAIHEALQILGAIRPVYPNMTPSTTGCTFLALYLKVHNKQIKNRELEKKFYDFMFEHCKAYRFRARRVIRPGAEIRQCDTDNYRDDSNESDESESSYESINVQGSQSAGILSGQGDQTYWLDLEAQADKKMWSAKVQHTDLKIKMALTLDDELLEIPEIPKAQVVLMYQTYTLRPSPLPPVSNCLTFIYSVTPPMTIREKFDFRTLYQPLPPFSSPYPVSVAFNPEKEFDLLLHKETAPESPSQPNLWTGKRTYSNNTIIPVKESSGMDPDLQLMIERYIPRFQLLDRISSVKVPPVPEVIEEEAIIFNPHRDYAYTMLLSEFFLTSHVLRCYEWDQGYQQLEHASILEKNLGLTDVQVEYFPGPHKPPSVSSRKSFDSYRDTFNAASAFATKFQAQAPCTSTENLAKEKSSLINFMQMIILEKLDELFHQVSTTSLSYDSYEINLLVTESDTNENQTSIIIREIFPYPPLHWDIVSRPYYAYISAPQIFEPPVLDNIAHERHFSVLDGIMEPNDEIKFVRYPTWIQRQQKKDVFSGIPKATSSLQCKASRITKPMFFVYDFFNLQWTSFLTYPFSWACNLDVKGHFCGFHNNTDSPFCANDFGNTEM